MTSLKFTNEWLQQKIENEPEGLTVEAGALELTSDEFALLCENPPSYEALELEIRLLKAELKQKDEKLSEFQNGLPIEKAKECGDYYCLDLGYCVATYFENGKWYYSDDGPNRNPCEVSNRLFPLPSTDTNGGYVND